MKSGLPGNFLFLHSEAACCPFENDRAGFSCIQLIILSMRNHSLILHIRRRISNSKFIEDDRGVTCEALSPIIPS